MNEPQKPFACIIPECGMTFTNEDHLHVHTKKHDLVLTGLEQKGAFVADQTPTPTRFIRNCEEVGLFQDLVNPFDEGFKRAIETKAGILSLENVMSSTATDDLLHTPQMIFPIIDGDSTLFSTTNNQRNITISRSSSDESGTIKEYETTTISKLTNEVTTISRVVGKQDIQDKIITKDDLPLLKQDLNKDIVNETSVSYTNNIIKIHSNVEIRKPHHNDTFKSSVPVSVISFPKDTDNNKNCLIVNNSISESNKLRECLNQVPPIMSQKSLDFVVDSLTSDIPCIQQTRTRIEDVGNSDNKTLNTATILPQNIDPSVQVLNPQDIEVIVKLRDGKVLKMSSIEDIKPDSQPIDIVSKETKEKLKKIIKKNIMPKIESNKIHTIPLNIPAGALIPIKIINTPTVLIQNSQKVPIAPLYDSKKTTTFKRRRLKDVPITEDKKVVSDLESRKEASKRYRKRLKVFIQSQGLENKELKEANNKLMKENAVLKHLITSHFKKCSNSADLQLSEDKILRISQMILPD